MTQDPYAAPKADLSEPVTVMDQDRFAELKKENKRLNWSSMLLGASGLLLQYFGGHLGLRLLGLVLLLTGLALYASMKGRSKWWGALGLFNLLGLLVLALISKYCRNCGQREKSKICQNCGGPVGV